MVNLALSDPTPDLDRMISVRDVVKTVNLDKYNKEERIK